MLRVYFYLLDYLVTYSADHIPDMDDVSIVMQQVTFRAPKKSVEIHPHSYCISKVTRPLIRLLMQRSITLEK